MATKQATAKRIMKEMEIMSKDNINGISAAPISSDDIHRWNAIIFGPEGTPYEGGIFQLHIDFPADYPFKPPRIDFITKIYHCNIANKYLCLDIIKNQWSPALTIDKVLLSIVSLLGEPNPRDPLNREAAHKFLESREEHDAIAREWTRKFATHEACKQYGTGNKNA